MIGLHERGRRLLFLFVVAVSLAGSAIAQQATRVATLDGHAEAVYAVVWSRDGKTLATAGFDNTVRLWDAATRKNLKTYDGHSKLVLAVAISPDGRRILSGSLDNTAKIWDCPVTGPLKSLGKLSAPLGHASARPDGTQFVASVGKTVAILDTSSGKTVAEQKEVPASGSITSTAWSGDAAHISTGDASGNIRLLKPDLSQEAETQTAFGAILAVGFLPDHKQLVSVHADGKARVWQLPQAPGKPFTPGNVVTLAPASEKAAKPLFTAVAVRPSSGAIFAASADKTIKSFDPVSGKLLQTFAGHTAPVLALAFSKDGGKLVSGSADKTVRVWNAADGKLLLTSAALPESVQVIAVSGKNIAAAGSATGAIHLFDLTATDPARFLVATYQSSSAGVTTVIFPPDASTLLVGSVDRSLEIWPLPGPAGPKTLSGHTGQVYAVAWSPDGKLAATASADKTARIWDATTGAQIRQLAADPGTVYAVAFSPKGDLLVTAGNDKLIKYWNPGDGKELRKSTGHGAPVYAVSFHPDGSRLASASVDKTLRIWNVADGKELLKLDGHPDDIYAVAWSPDGKRLASVGYAGNLFVWDAATGTPQFHQRVAPDTMTYGVAWSPDGKTLAVAGSTNRVYLLQLP